MSIIKSNMTASPATAAGGSGGALSTISEMNSLRFDGSSYLSRTFGGGDRKTWSFSLWVKRTNISSNQHLLHTLAYGGWGIDGSISFTTNGSIDFIYDYNAGNMQRLTTSAVYRDTSSWYHVVISAQDKVSPYKIAIHVNGVEVTSFTTNNQPDGTGGLFNLGYFHSIGSYSTTIPNLQAYLANIHFIDGQALDANAFGEEISGVWVPKQYDPATSGAYGTNGFHLDFAASNMDWPNSKWLDASGNGNDWNIN